jgi:catechol 2,3-dioxygenase-like lactoylglutathione lyase family enzyme
MGGFSVLRMFHPSLRVPSLDEAEEFYARVFGRPSTRMSVMLGMPANPDRPDYSTFTPVAEVLLDTIDPRKLWVGPVPADAEVDPHLHNTGWYVDDPDAAFRALNAAGITTRTQAGETVTGDEAPKAGGVVPMFFTDPDQVGQRYQVTVTNAMRSDARHAEGWTTPEVSPDDPLGIVRCARHTFLTGDPARGLRVALALGGTVVDEGRNEVLGATSTYVQLADGVLEYAVPDAGTPAAADLASREGDQDSYHALTWVVTDLDAAAKHLEAEGVAFRARTDDTLITDPATSLGVPWGFTVAS